MSAARTLKHQLLLASSISRRSGCTECDGVGSATHFRIRHAQSQALLPLMLASIRIRACICIVCVYTRIHCCLTTMFRVRTLRHTG